MVASARHGVGAIAQPTGSQIFQYTGGNFIQRRVGVDHARYTCRMSEFLALLQLGPTQALTLVVVAVLVGFAKTGIGGVTMLAIPLLATVFGGKTSTGVMLPLLITGDLLAVRYYHAHADWPGIRRLLPWTIGGLLTGIFVGNLIDDRQFAMLIAFSVLLWIAVLVYLELRAGQIKIPENTAFFALIGLTAGFTTMIGNVAGPIFSVFLLVRRYGKQSFMGTSAWFFAIINLIKLPLQIFFWQNITLHTGVLALMMLPAVLIGAVLGAMVIRRIPEKPFRWLVIVMTVLATVRLFF